MSNTRRELLGLALGAGFSARLPAGTTRGAPHAKPGRECVPEARAWGVGIEGQRKADLGDGRYLNPIVPGDHADPNILKDGADYYMTFSTFEYYPGIIIWHSRDLVNWQPVGPALKTLIGSVFALDLIKHQGRYFIYIPAINFAAREDALGIHVIHADNMRGPWSEPIDMHIYGFIDPGHAVGEDGKRYLFLNGGRRVRISDDGLARDGDIETVYAGWKYPDAWEVEGFALEGPKLMRRDGWFYLLSGEGGTAGPPTSHMVAVARSRSIHGPWENSPRNPVVRTASRSERWWSRGHGTLVEGPAGDWWMVYHGYENGMRTLGRQTLLEPIEWADGWPRALGGTLDGPLAKPRGGGAVPNGQAFSGPFTREMLGARLAFHAPQTGYLERVSIDDGVLVLAGQGNGPATSSPLAFIAGDRCYEVSVEVTTAPGAQAGLLLYYDSKLFCGLGSDGKQLRIFKGGSDMQLWGEPVPATAPRLWFRLRNREDVVTFWYSLDGSHWNKQVSLEVSGYNHNMADGFLSLRPALYAAGSGASRFRDLRYAAVDL